MLLDLQSTLKRRIAAGAAELFGVALGEAVLEVPRDLKNGDLATPVAFDLAKRIKAETGEKKNPRDLATSLAEWLRGSANAIDGISRIDIAGAGYINFYLNCGPRRRSSSSTRA
jgi:arginyl-tRNA synthetase